MSNIEKKLRELIRLVAKEQGVTLYKKGVTEVYNDIASNVESTLEVAIHNATTFE
jgi:hypothetical protein